MKKKLAGYRNQVSARSGETISFYVHVGDEAEYRADLIRIIHGGSEEGSPGLIFEPHDSEFEGTYIGQRQPFSNGSFIWLQPSGSGLAPLSSVSFACAIFPTYRNKGRDKDKPQTIASGLAGADLVISETGHLSLVFEGRVVLAIEQPIPHNQWSFVGLSYDARANFATLHQSTRASSSVEFTSQMTQTERSSVELGVSDFNEITFAARTTIDEAGIHRPTHSFNGRIESPRLMSRVCAPDALDALVLMERPDLSDPDLEGFWDFSDEMTGRSIRDLSKNNIFGRLENLPTRAVAGFRWTGEERDWRRAPREYGAIHFHEDDIYDMKWSQSFSWTVPEDTRSGLYAARIVSGDETEYLTFFVVPKVSAPKASIAIVASTATYLSYANERARYAVDQLLGGGDMEVSPEMQMLLDTPEFGASQYESHKDRSGIHFSSYLRPLLNWRPDTTMWAMNADTALLHWLEQGDWDYDVITDHDIHRDGACLLKNYQTILTGTHPEYLSTQMFDAYETYLADGGRLMYMGGNGFYWRVAFSDDWPAAMEVRRAEGGTRAWFARPGEYHHAFNGEYGGLWRNQGRAPNSLVGVGFAAQGFSRSTYYRKTAQANNPRAAFVFKDVDDEIIGNFGLRGGGAAGEEIDRYDRSLGSPAHGLVLASSEDDAPDMLRVIEEFAVSIPHGKDPAVRADMTFFETPSGGAVFSTGSIAWSGALCHNQYDNSVAKISANVLNRFLDDTPFVFQDAT